MLADSRALEWQPDEFLAGAFANKDNVHDPALKFLHGTTTLGFVFSKGIIITVDSRASMGSYVGATSAPRWRADAGAWGVCVHRGAGRGGRAQRADARVQPVQARRL